MGWCSGTLVFDQIVKALLDARAGKPVDTKAVIKVVIDALEEGDWDCQQDSDYWDDPLVRKAFKELHPDWDWD